MSELVESGWRLKIVLQPMIPFLGSHTGGLKIFIDMYSYKSTILKTGAAIKAALLDHSAAFEALQGSWSCVYYIPILSMMLLGHD